MVWRDRFGTYGMETWSEVSRRGQYNVPGTAQKLAERPSLPPFHWVSGLLFRTRQLERETNHLLPSRSGLNVWSHTSLPSHVFMACCLIKQRNDFTLAYCGNSLITTSTFRRRRCRLWGQSILHTSAWSPNFYCEWIRVAVLTAHVQLIFGAEFVDVRYHVVYIH